MPPIVNMIILEDGQPVVNQLLAWCRAQLELSDGDGRICALRRGYPLGRERVMAAREMMEGGWGSATAASEPSAELAAEAGGARKRRPSATRCSAGPRQRLGESGAVPMPLALTARP